jgi:hypothetical protein
MTDEEKQALLNIPIDNNTTVKSANTLTFVQWCLKKINGADANAPETREIIALNVFPGANMDDNHKLEILLKLKKLGVI